MCNPSSPTPTPHPSPWDRHYLYWLTALSWGWVTEKQSGWVSKAAELAVMSRDALDLDIERTMAAARVVSSPESHRYGAVTGQEQDWLERVWQWDTETSLAGCLEEWPTGRRRQFLQTQGTGGAGKIAHGEPWWLSMPLCGTLGGFRICGFPVHEYPYLFFRLCDDENKYLMWSTHLQDLG